MLGCGATDLIHPVMRHKRVEEENKKDLARKELKQAAAEILKNIKAGPVVENKGIYLGRMRAPSDCAGRNIFLDFYEAPESLTIDFGSKPPSVENAALALAGLKNWHGHNGSYFANSENICDALVDGGYRVHINYIAYKGQWFFPDMLIQKDMLFPKQGSFRLCRAERLEL